MKLAIADPPYPPLKGSGGYKARASRWYGDRQRSASDRPADHHDDASYWDDRENHRALFNMLLGTYDGFAIATSPDGIAAYGPLPDEVRIMAWVKPNACPGAHRLLSRWEAVILLPPKGRRSNRSGNGSVSDVLVEPIPTHKGFRGLKPHRWTHWILDAFTYNPVEDTVTDLFPGSGAVTDAVASYQKVHSGSL